jgi:hypothetical protein
MPVIKVWCLPADRTEDDLRRLHQGIVAAVLSVPEPGLRSEHEMVCLFPPDLMQYGLGEEIVVEVTGLFEKPECTLEVRNQLAQSIGERVETLYPEAMVEVFVYPFNQDVSGFWKAG